MKNRKNTRLKTTENIFLWRRNLPFFSSTDFKQNIAFYCRN